MKNSVTGQVMAILEEQAALYGDLLSLAQKKRQTLVAGGGNEFEAILQGEQVLVLKAGRLEEKRLAAQSDLAAVLGVSASSLNASSLAQALPVEEAARLTELMATIMTTIDELKRTNDLNMKLLQRSLTYINSMFQSLGRLKKSAVYSGDGRYSPPDKRHRLDHQI